MARQSQFVANVLRFALSQPPAQAGMRLCSERDIGLLLNTGRRQIGDALNELAKMGVVIRNRGSGTYIRKVIPLPTDRATDLRKCWEQSGLRSPAQLLLDRVDSPVASRIDRRGQLHIGFWGDWLVPSPRHQMAMAKMVEAVEAGGHVMTVHSLVSEPEVPLPASVLASRVDRHDFDGLLVVSRWARHFIRAVGYKPGMPVVFCGNDRGELPGFSRVVEASATPIRRAIVRLHRAGYRRIGGLFLQGSETRAPQRRKRVYERQMQQLGTTYRACETATAGDVVTGLGRLLDRADPPDALFIGDDHLLHGVASGLAARGIEPGRDIGLICLTNRDVTQAPHPDWSQYQAQPGLMGRMAVRQLLDLITSPSKEPCDIVLLPIWQAGTTHRRRERNEEVGTDAVLK